MTRERTATNGGGGRPAAERVAGVLRTRIRDGVLRAGEPVPTHAALAEEFRVERSVIRQALRMLLGEGLLTVTGRGVPARVASGAVLRHSLTALGRTRGIDVEVSVRALPFTPPMKLYLLNGDEALFAHCSVGQRTEETDGTPVGTAEVLGADPALRFRALVRPGAGRGVRRAVAAVVRRSVVHRRDGPAGLSPSAARTRSAGVDRRRNRSQSPGANSRARTSAPAQARFALPTLRPKLSRVTPTVPMTPYFH